MSSRSAAATRRDVAAEEYAAAMSSLASGVVLVTSRHAGRPWGMTVTAFASVSVHPPTVLVSLGSRTVSARAIAATGSFGVSLLARGQVDVATYGAVGGETKFLDALVEPAERRSATPAIAHALAHLDCEVVDVVHAADHTVFFGRVQEVRRRCGEDPLLYHGRGYGSFVPLEPTTERTLRCISN